MLALTMGCPPHVWTILPCVLLLSADDCNIWDEGSDQEGNIRFDKKRPGVVVGATFNKLVERITSLTDHGKK